MFRNRVTILVIAVAGLFLADPCLVRAASSNGTTIPSASGIVDSGGNLWTATLAGQIDENGHQVSGGGTMVLLLYYNRTIYAKYTMSGQNLWFSWNGSVWINLGLHGDPRLSASLILNGACGASNGMTLSSAPSANLCSTGTASAVSGSGPWTWSCAGSNGGTNAVCQVGKSSDAPLVPAFYVAIDGDDNSSGTSASAPFATLARAQRAMRTSHSIKTTYIRAGVYAGQPAITSASNCLWGKRSSIVSLSGADSGESWSYYPPDGFNSAILDGGSTTGSSGTKGGNGAGCAFGGYQASNVTITGLQFENFLVSAAWLDSSPKFTFTNNVIHNLTSATFNGGAVSLTGSPTAVIANNYMSNLAYIGIGIWAQIDNDIVSGNAIINSCTWPAVVGGGNDQNGGDCGAIYAQNVQFPVSTNIKIQNNYIRDVNAPSNEMGIYDWGSPGGMGIYLDDGASNVTVSGNIVAGHLGFCFYIHGGNNESITGNICDLSNSTPVIVGYGTDGLGNAMTGNLFESNIVVSGSPGAGSGFVGGSCCGGPPKPPNPMTIRNNVYFNFVGSSINSQGRNNAGSDANPIHEDPQILCWSPVIAQDSAVFKSPVGFPGISRQWGPPGFVVPHLGTPPSWPHRC